MYLINHVSRKLKEKLFAAKKAPEHSLTLRLIILAAMLVPLLALARVSVLWPHALLAGLGMSLGHGYIYRCREQPSQLVRAVMFTAIHLALFWMFYGLFNGLAVPQAQFAMFAQAITSFDLRYRANLFNTLIHSLANLYVAASLSRTTELGLYLILFAGLVLAAFFVVGKEDGLRLARLYPKVSPASQTALPHSPTPKRAYLIFGLSFGGAALAGILIVFIFTPRFAGRPLFPPFTLNAPMQGSIKSEIINPGLPLVQINGWSDGTSDYYYGFDTELDLRYRGGLSDAMVMVVRSPSRSYWRSHSYDFYNGLGWSQSDKSLAEIRGRAQVIFEIFPPLGAPLSEAEAAGRGQRRPGSPHHIQELFDLEKPAGAYHSPDQQIVQTFTIVREQPNLIFAAYRPAEVFIPAEQVSLDSCDGIRLPQPLQAGLTYSVISYRPDFEPAQLRRASTAYPPDIARRYLQLPDNISERVRTLARTLTAPYDNNYDKIVALNEHLLREYPYNFFPPPHPPGAEVVDTFLFEDREGVCEQYVTALVIMARSLGIPARLASGYGAGDYNPITGYYEVRLNHAHSWAEIYFPEYGWAPFDPTPGWTPQPYPTPVQTWLFSNSNEFLTEALSGLNLPLAALMSSGMAGLSLLGLILVGGILVAALVWLAVWLSRRLSRIWAWRAAQRYSRLSVDPTRRLILKLYHRGTGLLTRRAKHPPRQPWETLGEYAQRAGPSPALLQLTQAAEVAAYQPETPGPNAVAQAQAALAALREEITLPQRPDPNEDWS